MLTGKAILALIAVVTAAVGAVVNEIWGPRGQARRRLRAGSRELVDNAVVTLTGTVRPSGEPLSAPLSGKPCVVHHSFAKIRAAAARGRPSAVIRELASREIAKFVLVTAQGDVVIDSQRAELELRPAAIVPRRLELEVSFLHHHGADDADPRLTEFEEIVIETGERVSVHGVVRVERDPSVAELDYRATPQRVRLTDHPDHPLTIGRARGR